MTRLQLSTEIIRFALHEISNDEVMEAVDLYVREVLRIQRLNIDLSLLEKGLPSVDELLGLNEQIDWYD